MLMVSRYHGFVTAAATLPLAWLVVACSSSPTAPTNGPFLVSGVVRDFQTDVRVARATVSFGDIDSSAVLADDPRSLTDSGGLYELGLMPRRYHVWVDGVYRGETIVRRGVNRTDLFVRDGGCAVRYGTVADAVTGRTVAGASVSLINVTASTASDGTYRLEFGCRGPFAFAGTIVMTVSRAGFQTRSVPMGRGENLVNAIRQDVDLNPE